MSAIVDNNDDDDVCNVIPMDDLNNEWKHWYCVMLEKCNKCNFVRFSGCRNSIKKQQQGCADGVQHSNCDNRSKTEVNFCPSLFCKHDHLRTIPLKVNNEMEVFCYGDEINGKTCSLAMDKSSSCHCCKQSDFGFERTLVKVKKSELKYALRSFPADIDRTDHSIIMCSCCKAIGFPGIGGELTAIKNGHAFWAKGDEDIDGVDRLLDDWDIDHTPDCTCMKETGDDVGYYRDIPTMLTRNELEYACRAIKRSSSCLNIVKKSKNLIDNFQTQLAVLNNRLLNKFGECVDDQEIRACIHELITLLTHNEAFLSVKGNDFPILVLSNIESFIVKAKQLRQRIGKNGWGRNTAKAFGTLLKKAKSLRKRRSSRKSKVLFMPDSFDSGLSTFGKKKSTSSTSSSSEKGVVQAVDSNNDQSKLRIRSSSS
jgi:hypothetical protein